ncbi:MAG TPA: type II toxin-antitoxin system RelE/ParE family toxin [Gammaproteobacteria bacterium]|nr:type II toxin-antitoxin system RelE/ParE family toxin [Gammaproteobacteria bacterium]
MKEWVMRYWDEKKGRSSIERWLDKLDKEHLKSVSKEIKILSKIGNELKLPHSKPLKSGLFELRDRRFGYRLYYCFYGEYVIVLLAAGDKSGQQNDIKIARERLKIIEKEGL